MDEVLRQQMINSITKNRRQVFVTINHLNSLHVRSLQKGTRVNELELDNLFAKVILPLWVSLFEVELDRILFRHPVFDTLRIDPKFIRRSERTKWSVVVDQIFKAQYALNDKQTITKTTLGDTAYHRYKSIQRSLDNLDTYIQLRNRIAHGQWAIAFNDLGDSKNENLTQKAWTLSKKDMMIIKIYYENLPKMVNELCSSRTQFEDNYDQHMNKLNLVALEIEERFKRLKARTPRIIQVSND